MKNIYLLFFVFTISFISQIDAQTGAFCNFDPQFKTLISNRNSALQYAQKERVMHNIAQENRTRNGMPSITIPVVVHCIGASANDIVLTNKDIEIQIEKLNQIYGNTMPFVAPNGTNTDIQFCLAKSDPQGNISNGITRDVSTQVYDNQCIMSVSATKDVLLKQINTWDVNRYFNIWIVSELRDECDNCAITSYGYSALFAGIDGVVMEQKIFKNEPKTLSHEVGHALGLYHTFHQGCRNDDCLIDGDLVCDTPPDVAQYADCNSNSCNTDTKAVANNPFNTDVEDDNSNIMDISECPLFHFTNGQAQRMKNYITKLKPSWQLNNSCNTSALDFLVIDTIKLQNSNCIKSFCPKIVVKNYGANDIKTLKINVLLNGMNTVEDWTGKIAPNETIEIQLACQTAILNQNTLKIDVSFANGNPHINLFDNNIQVWTVAETPKITNVKATASKCTNDGTLLITASKGATPYIYSIAGVSAQQTTPLLTGLSFGPYNVVVTDANMCSDTLPVLVKDSCIVSPNNGFIVNGNATLQANDCITLTEAQKTKVGSVWYKDKISLKRSFDVFYSMNLGCTDGNGADGIAFVLQPISTSIGTPGSGMGYQGINPSIAVEFDSWQNGQNTDPTYDHTAIMINGVLEHSGQFNLAGPVPILGTVGAPKNAEDCAFHKVRISWFAPTQTITVYVDCVQKLTYTGDLITKALFGISDVYLGFTASTGGATNKHQVCFEHVSFLDELEEKTICSGGSIQVSANKNFKSYQWLPNIDLDNNTLQSPKFFPKVSTIYTLKMTDNCGFSVLDTIKINVINPSITTNAIDNSPCTNVVNSTVIITSPTQSNGFQFSFDGKTFSNINDKIYNTLGNKTVYAQKGNSISASVVNIKKDEPLKLELMYDKLGKCNDYRKIGLKASGGKAPYLFSDNGGVTWQTNGSFDQISINSEILLKDANNCTQQLDISNNCVPFNDKLIIDSMKVTKTCFDTSTYLNVRAIGEYGNIFYQLDKGKIQDNGVFKNLKNGVHKVYLKADEGCVLDSLDVEVIDKTQLFSIDKDTTICAGKNVVFWNKTYSLSGSYAVVLKNKYGCDSTLNLKLTVRPALKQTQKLNRCKGDFVTIGKNTYNVTNIYTDTLVSVVSGCDSILTTDLKFNNLDTVTFSASTCDASKVKYDTQILKNTLGCDSVFITDIKYKAPSAFVLKQTICETGFIVVNGTKYDKNKRSGTEIVPFGSLSGCDSIITVDLTVSQIFANVINNDPTCFGKLDGSVEIKDISLGTPPFSLSFNNSVFQTISLPYKINKLKSGIYPIVIKDKLGCELQNSVFLKNPDPISVTLGADKTIQLGDSVALFPVVDFITNKTFWSSQSLVNCTDCPALFVNPIKKGNYVVTVYDKNNCAATDNITVFVQKGNDVFVPNAFSPNGDGNNDFFTVFARKSVKSINNFKIFDRWGELVYVADSLGFNNQSQGWDGTFRGQAMQSDVFTFTFDVLYIDNSREKRSGEVFLSK